LYTVAVLLEGLRIDGEGIVIKELIRSDLS